MATKQAPGLGIDIGSQTVKLCEVSRDVAGPHVTAIAVKPIKTYGPDDPDADDVHRIAGIVRSAIEESGARAEDAVVAVSGPSVVIRYIELPKMELAEAREAMRFEADQHIPFDSSDVMLDLHIQEGEAASDPAKMRAILVAAKTDVVNQCMAVAESSGARLSAIDVESFALVNAFEATCGEVPEGEVVALVHMGAMSTAINIVRGGRPQFSRELSVGGSAITDAVAKKLGCPKQEAELRKKTDGDIEGDDEVALAMRSVLEDLVSELRLSFDYYENQSMDGGIDVVRISGGTSRLANVTGYLTNALRAPVQQWDVLGGMSVDEGLVVPGEMEKLSPLMPVALGLALRAEVTQ